MVEILSNTKDDKSNLLAKSYNEDSVFICCTGYSFWFQSIRSLGRLAVKAKLYQIDGGSSSGQSTQ